MLTITDISALCIAITLVCLIALKKRTSSVKLPPGPPSGFLIGHARRLPTKNAWETYSEWKRVYGRCYYAVYAIRLLKTVTVGDVVYSYAFGRSILILNTVAAARDLMEKKGANFSDRPLIPFINM